MKYTIPAITTLILGLSCGQAFSSSVHNSDVLNLNGADAFVSAFDDSTVNLLASSDVAFLDLYGNSTANLHGGVLSWLTMHGTSSANIYSSELSWLLMKNDAKVNVFGSNLSYNGGHLTGTWANGANFSFWALNITDNNDLVLTSLDTMPSNISLNAVPLPPSFLLFASSFGVLGLRLLRKR